jgi:ATP-dependent DNA ligase
VPTGLAACQEDLDRHYEDYRREGYEGQIIRLPGYHYEMRRHGQLLKRKEFLDAEFPVVGFVEGSGAWKGTAKSAVLKLPDGQEFHAGLRGTREWLRSVWESGFTPDAATVRYSAMTPAGIPRFPVVVRFWDDWRDI